MLWMGFCRRRGIVVAPRGVVGIFAGGGVFGRGFESCWRHEITLPAGWCFTWLVGVFIEAVSHKF